MTLLDTFPSKKGDEAISFNAEACDLDVTISYCHCTLLDTTMISLLVPVAERRGVRGVRPCSVDMLAW